MGYSVYRVRQDPDGSHGATCDCPMVWRAPTLFDLRTKLRGHVCTPSPPISPERLALLVDQLGEFGLGVAS